MKKILFIFLLFFSVMAFSQEKVPTNQDLEEQIERLSYELEKSKEEAEELNTKITEVKEESKYRDTYYLGVLAIVIPIIVALLGILIPIWMKSSKERNAEAEIEKIKKLYGEIEILKELSKSIGTKVGEIETIKGNVKILEQKIEQYKKEAEQSSIKAAEEAKKAKISALNSEASNEKDLDKKIKLYTEVIDLAPRDDKAYYNLGYTYWEKGECDKAIENYSKSIKINSKFAFIYICRGAAYSQKKLYDEAIENYDKAIEINPTDAYSYTCKGNAYGYQMRYNLAIENYDKAIEMGSEEAYIYSRKGEAYSGLMRYDEAIKNYDKAIEVDPEYSQAYYNRERIHRIFAEKETDTTKKAQYLEQAEADKKKYEELKDKQA